MRYLILLTIIASGVLAQKCRSPVSIDRTQQSCSYLNKFELDVPNSIISVSGQRLERDNNNYRFYDFPADSLKLKASAPSKEKFDYVLTEARVATPAEHQFKDLKFANNDIVELQLQFKWKTDITDEDQDAPEVSTAIVSVLLTSVDNMPTDDNKQKLTYLPEGENLLLPFMTVGNLAGPDSSTVADINFSLLFKQLDEYYHQWFAYEGTAPGECATKVNWYINNKVFVVPAYVINHFKRGAPVDPTEPTIRTLDSGDILMICFSGFEETVMRENYALWLFLLGTMLWWIFEIALENDTAEVFMDHFNRNRWTQIPFYSMYWVNSDVFFTKMSRCLHWLVMFAFEVMILSILYGQLVSNEERYQLEDAIILWYALVALIVTWPIGYFFGAISYNIRQTYKDKLKLAIEYKKLPNKTTLEAVDLARAIEDEETRIFTYYYINYFLLFTLFIMCFCVSVWQNTFLNADLQDYWVATIFVLLFLDLCVFDFIVAFVPGPVWTKYRGYYYDFELGQLFKHYEEL